MKALQIRSFGGADVVELRDIPVPDPAPGQVRIRVHAAAANPVDIQTRSGMLVQAGIMAPRPWLGLGWDAAGEIDAVGAGVVAFRPGDRVLALSDRLMAAAKAQAELLVVDASAAARVPDDRDLVELSALPLAGLTALQALTATRLRSGDTVLITGAAGAVGGYALQLAARRGLRVVASARPSDEESVRSQGADEFVPSTAPLGDRVRSAVPGGVDAAIDVASLGIEALDAVRNEGEFVSLLGAGPVPLRGITVHSTWIRADGDQLSSLIAADLVHRVAGVHTLEDAATVHEALERPGVRGKLIYSLV